MKTKKTISHQVDAVVSGQIRNKKRLLAVVHVLLDALTEIPCANSTVITVMNAIEKKTPLTLNIWRSNFEIIYEGKPIFKWNNGNIEYLSR